MREMTNCKVVPIKEMILTCFGFLQTKIERTFQMGIISSNDRFILIDLLDFH